MNLDRIVTHAVEIQQIPGPTFEEGERSAYLERHFHSAGLEQISIDDLGNVYGRVGSSNGAHIVVSAHLDSVFPSDTELRVRRQGSDLIGPGIGDNAIALSLMLELAIEAAENTYPSGGFWVVGNVREEGLGNLEGMQRVTTRFGGWVKGFIVLEGIGLGHIYNRGLHVNRYRISVETQGGHAWIHAGQASAIHTLLELGADISRMDRPEDVQNSLNIGTVRGGTSINTIASSASFDLDLRSESPSVLIDIGKRLETTLEQHRSEEVVIKSEVIGHRPGGEIPSEHELVQLAREALRAGEVTDFKIGIASTDANVPLSQGYPAICVGLTKGGYAHSMREYIDINTIPNGYKVLDYLVQGALTLPSVPMGDF